MFSIDYGGFASNSGTYWNAAGCQSIQLYQGKIASWLYVCLETQCSVNMCVCISCVLCLEKDKWFCNRTKASIQGGDVEQLTFVAFNEYTLLLHSDSWVLSKLYSRRGRQNTSFFPHWLVKPSLWTCFSLLLGCNLGQLLELFWSLLRHLNLQFNNWV